MKILKILTGKQQKPRRLLIYGPHGVGKSTLAAMAPDPIFLDIEDGLGDIDCAKSERLRTARDVLGAMIWLNGNETPYKSIVIDSLDWLERLIWQGVAEKEGKDSIGEIPYGNGYKLALKGWELIVNSLQNANQKGKHIILLAHAKIAKFSPPDQDSYDRYEPALHDLANRLVQEWCDEVLFLNTKVHIRKADEGFGNKRSIAIGGKDRVIRTTESASVIAKHRCELPEELDCDSFWQTYLAASSNGKGNIQGLVVDGSSKRKEVASNG